MTMQHCIKTHKPKLCSPEWEKLALFVIISLRYPKCPLESGHGRLEGRSTSRRRCKQSCDSHGAVSARGSKSSRAANV
jgi:hypothetical protein